MAFFRFNRDKRGYEHFYLVEPVTNRRGKSRPRVLYWYRTPPNIRVGRAPFDDEVQRALEAQNPSVVFDWPKIVDAPIPSADAEKWRERRRVERAGKAARQATAATAERIESESRESDDTEQAPPASPAPGTLVGAAAIDVDRIRKRRRRRRGRIPQADAAQASPPSGAGAPDTVTHQAIEPTATPEEVVKPIDSPEPSSSADTRGD
jgi:hypothetical protein